MFRVVVVFLCLFLPPTARPPVEFLQPRARVILASLHGTDIPVQIRIEPHVDNRAYAIAWCGEGVHVHTLDGADDAAIHPVSPLTIRVYAGDCDLIATIYGPGDVIRARTTLTLRVCGGGEENACDSR